MRNNLVWNSVSQYYLAGIRKVRWKNKKLVIAAFIVIHVFTFPTDFSSCSFTCRYNGNGSSPSESTSIHFAKNERRCFEGLTSENHSGMLFSTALSEYSEQIHLWCQYPTWWASANISQKVVLFFFVPYLHFSQFFFQIIRQFTWNRIWIFSFILNSS